MYFLLNDDTHLIWDGRFWYETEFGVHYEADQDGHPVDANGVRLAGVRFQAEKDMDDYRQDRQAAALPDACRSLVAAYAAMEAARQAYGEAEARFRRLKDRAGVDVPVVVGDTLIDFKGGKYVFEPIGFKVVG